MRNDYKNENYSPTIKHLRQEENVKRRTKGHFNVSLDAKESVIPFYFYSDFRCLLKGPPQLTTALTYRRWGIRSKRKRRGPL
jgi:hypothetical protein